MEDKKVLIFDTETTGLPPKGAHYERDFDKFPHIVQLAWDYNGVENDFIIKPDGYVIPEEVSKIHGITQERAMDEGCYIDVVLTKFINDCWDSGFIVAHNIYFDTSIVKANILKKTPTKTYWDGVEDSLHKSKRIDTMMSTINFVAAKFPDSNRNKFPKLEELYFKLFREEFEAHNAIEDVRAVKRCLPELIKLGLVKFELKTYE